MFVMDKISLIKMIRFATVPNLGLLDAKILAEKMIEIGLHHIDRPESIAKILRITKKINDGEISFDEAHQLVWGKPNTLSLEDLKAISL